MKHFYIIPILLFTLIFASFAAPAQETNVSAKSILLEGQVVCCADCWAEKDRLKVEFGTAEDLLVAKGCVAGGDPTLLAVRIGDEFTLYQLEEGEYQLPGENWLEFVGKHVLITGSTRKEKKTHIVRVDTLEVTADSLAAREAKAALGQTGELKLNDLFGAEQSLSQFTGRIVVLNFWATYCVPCREEMPDLAAIQNEYAAFGVQVIGASSDAIEDRAKVLQFIRETKINFPIWMGASGADMSRFGLGEALPGTVVIDRTGKIVKVISGVVSADDLRKQIDSMLGAAEAILPTPEPIAAVPKKPKVSSVPS